MKILRHTMFVLLMLSLISCSAKYSASATGSEQQINSQLAFCGKEENSERYDVYLLDLNTREWRNITEKYVFKIDDSFGYSIGCDEDMNPYRVTGMVWSPRGDLIIADAGGPYLNVPYIMRVLENGDITNIVEQWPGRWSMSQIFVHPFSFEWSPDEGSIAFTGMTAADGYSNLFIGDVTNWKNSNPDTSVMLMTYEYRDFPGVIYAPSWSPDGKYVAVSLSGHASGLGIVSVNSNQVIYITDDNTKELISHVEHPNPWDDFPAWKPSWFPDTSAVVFVGARKPRDRSTLFKVNSDGSNLTVIVPSRVRNPVVSPDGQSIAFIENPRDFELKTIGRIVLVDPEGDNRKVLVTIRLNKIKTIFKKYYIRDLSWSPDGKWLVFTSNFSGEFQLYLLSADGSQFEQIIDFPGNAVYPQWRPGIKP